MARNLFSVPIFFIVFRETLEAAIILSVLFGLADQIVHDDRVSVASNSADEKTVPSEDSEIIRRRLLRKMRIQILVGGALGLFLAVAIGAAFIAVWFTKATDLWSKSEAIWEAIFQLIASLMIFFMAVTMLKINRAKARWRVKLERAFDGQVVDTGVKTGKWALFVLPFITVLREGLEAVVFVGGVSLGQPASSIPIAAVCGIVCGFACGFLIYQFASRTTLTIFLVVMTNFLLLIGSGLFSRSIGAFQEHYFNTLLGADIDDAGGDGPGSYLVQGNVWHLPCCNPENKFGAQGWKIFAALLGWTNNATLGTVLGYVFYWLAVVAVLVYMKYKEGRAGSFGKRSGEKSDHAIEPSSEVKGEKSA